MKRLTLVLVALAAGAGAVYYLDPQHGRRRRAEVAQQVGRWRLAAGRTAQGRTEELRNRLAGLLAEGRALLQRLREGRTNTLPAEDDGLEPLSFTPAPLEQEAATRSRLLPVLAVAAPVALAVGAAMFRQRHETGDWLH